jgi:hypothetical protein
MQEKIETFSSNLINFLRSNKSMFLNSISERHKYQNEKCVKVDNMFGNLKCTNILFYEIFHRLTTVFAKMKDLDVFYHINHFAHQ